MSSQPPAAWLLFSDADGAHAVPLTPPGVVIGRDPAQCDVAVKDYGLSRRHARIDVLPDGRMTLTDLKSKGGSQVNGQAVVDSPVALDDKILLGRVPFLIAQEPPADPAAGGGGERFLVNVGAEVGRFFDDTSLPGTEPPKFVLLLGGVSSGKSYTRRRQYKRGFVIVDAGEIFISLSRGGYYDFPDGLQEPLETIGTMVALRAISERRNVVTEMLATDREQFGGVFRAMTTIGYRAEVVWIECDPEVGKQRNEARGDLDISSAFCQEYHSRWLLAAAQTVTPKKS